MIPTLRVIVLYRNFKTGRKISRMLWTGHYNGFRHFSTLLQSLLYPFHIPTYLVVGTKNGVTCSFVQTMTCTFFKSKTSWLLTILLSHYIKRLIWWQDVTILRFIQRIKIACCFFYSRLGLIWINLWSVHHMFSPFFSRNNQIFYVKSKKKKPCWTNKGFGVFLLLKIEKY